MVMEMKKVLLFGLFALLIGGGLSFYFLKDKIKKGENTDIEYSKAQAFQVGVFSNHDNASRVALRNNGIVVNDGDVYRVYVALLTDEEVVKKLESYYKEIGLNYYLKDITVNNKFTESIDAYERLLLKSSSETYGAINLDILHKYQESL